MIPEWIAYVICALLLVECVLLVPFDKNLKMLKRVFFTIFFTIGLLVLVVVGTMLSQ